MGIDKVSGIQRQTSKEQKVFISNILITFRCEDKIRIKEVTQTSETKHKIIKMLDINVWFWEGRNKWGNKKLLKVCEVEQTLIGLTLFTTY